MNRSFISILLCPTSPETGECSRLWEGALSWWIEHNLFCHDSFTGHWVKRMPPDLFIAISIDHVALCPELTVNDAPLWHPYPPTSSSNDKHWQLNPTNKPHIHPHVFNHCSRNRLGHFLIVERPNVHIISIQLLILYYACEHWLIATEPYDRIPTILLRSHSDIYPWVR